MRLLALFLMCSFYLADHAQAQSPEFDWSGPYLGAGLMATTARAAGLPKAEGTGRHLLIGHDWQFGRVVLGVEAALSDSRIYGNTTCRHIPRRCTLSDNRFASLRARAGVAHGRALGFVTLGVAHDRWEHSIGPRYKTTRGRGVVLGVGAEIGLMSRVSLRLEGEQVRMIRSMRLDGGRTRLTKTSARVSLIRRF